MNKAASILPRADAEMPASSDASKPNADGKTRAGNKTSASSKIHASPCAPDHGAATQPSPAAMAPPPTWHAGQGGIGRRALGGMGLLLAAGCSPARVLNDLAPQRLVARDIAYGDGPRRTLDVYAPDPALTTAPPPVVVFLYGGGWKDGSKAMYRFVGGALAQRGAVVVIPDYRLYPQVRYPDFLQDCAAAVRWACDNSASLAAQPSGERAGHAGGPVFLMGHSAGAYNAAMLALDARWLGAEGLRPREALRGLIGLAGPYDFLPLHTAELASIFGGADRVDTQPITYAGVVGPPAFLAAGSADTTVMPANTLRLAARIRVAGGFAEERIYPGVNHVEIIGAMATPLRFLAPSLRDSLGFLGLRRHEGAVTDRPAGAGPSSSRAG